MPPAGRFRAGDGRNGMFADAKLVWGSRRCSRRSGKANVPTLIRLLLVLGVLAVLVFGAMTAMVTYMRPAPRAISQTIVIPQGNPH